MTTNLYLKKQQYLLTKDLEFSTFSIGILFPKLFKWYWKTFEIRGQKFWVKGQNNFWNQMCWTCSKRFLRINTSEQTNNRNFFWHFHWFRLKAISRNIVVFIIISLNISKVHIFEECHIILQNLHCTFVRYYIGQI